MRPVGLRTIANRTTGLTAVSKTLTSTYNVVAQISKTLAASYTVRVVVSKTSSASYLVQNSIVKNVTPTYNVIVRVTKTLSPSYTLVAGPPVNVTLPVITGQPLSGQLLTTSNGAWTNSPTGYTYQWQVEDSPGSGTYSNIAGETGSTLQL